MGLNIGSGSVTANIINNQATQKQLTFVSTVQDTGAGSPVTLGTVGAGKQWTIISVAHSTNSVSNTATTSYIQVGGQTITNIRSEGIATSVANSNQCLVFAYDSAPVLTVGQTIQLLISGNGARNSVAIGYIEESV